MTVYASAGEVITCENGHEYATFVRDVLVNELVDVGALTLASTGAHPVHGEPPERCHCGAEAVRMDWTTGTFAHFRDGWRVCERETPQEEPAAPPAVFRDNA